MTELRPARAEDINAIVSVDPLGPGRASEIRELLSRHPSTVAVAHGKVAGFVATDSRRQGTGRALMRAALRNASTPRIFTSANESNTPMRKLLYCVDIWHCGALVVPLHP